MGIARHQSTTWANHPMSYFHRAYSRIFCSCAAAIGATFALATATLAQQFPYEARVVVPAASIQSGPGDEFYPTDTLPEGAVVEIYHHSADGWCAIRPPENSFSWVYAGHLQKLDSTVAEVNKDDVASRIGSRLNDNRNAVQVRLKRGEVVQMIGGETIAGQTWCKIAPPAGEFRWIHSSNIRPTQPQSTSTATSEIVTVAASTDDFNASQVVTADAEQAVSPVAPVAEQETPVGEDDWRASTDPAATERDSSPSPVASSATSPPIAPLQPAASLAAGELDRQLAELELRLSRAVTGPPQLWNIDVLRREAEPLLAHAQTAAERESVNVTLSKLDRFAAIERRYESRAGNVIGPVSTMATGAVPTMNGTAVGPGAPPTPLLPSPVGNSNVASATTVNGMSYDAAGILRPVVSKRPGAPQFALVDEQGRVLSFVSAAPDVNLQPYIGHRVAVAGNRGFIPEFQRAHVTAGRVTPLTAPILR